MTAILLLIVRNETGDKFNPIHIMKKMRYEHNGSQSSQTGFIGGFGNAKKSKCCNFTTSKAIADKNTTITT